MLTLIRGGRDSVWALLLLACSTHDASLGESKPQPTPGPVPPLAIMCESRGGACIPVVLGACSDGRWEEGSCQDPQQRCCVRSVPPTSRCEDQAGALCFPSGEVCNRPLTGYECTEGHFCCAGMAPGQGLGGSSVGMGAPAGAGG